VSFRTGRREANRGGVAGSSASPNFLDPKLYNPSAAKDMVANSIELTGNSFNDLGGRADSSNPTQAIFSLRAGS
jgi:hypothetical protein